MTVGTASVAVSRTIGHQDWEQSATGRMAPRGGFNLRFVLVAAAIGVGLVGGIVLAHLIG